MGLDRDALDRWITSGRYSKALIAVICSECEEVTHVTAETEYGGTTWEPGECEACKTVFTGDEKWEDDEPPEPDPDRYHDEDGRYEPWA